MMRWDRGLGSQTQDDDVDAFLLEVIQVCRKHGFALGHEDEHGGFRVQKHPNPDWERWLLEAHID
jgi:hypothetical protein